jgi:hypothetical protein
MIKFRKIRWVVHVAHTGRVRSSYKLCSEELRSRGLLDDLDINGVLILKWLFKTQTGRET